MSSSILSAVFLLSFVCSGLATVCVNSYHGRCVDISHGCNSGESYSLNYCGFLEMCCLSPSGSGSGSSSNGTSSGSSHGVSGATCGTSNIGSTHTNKIVGGTNAQHGEFPWQ
ncbi:plasma kallikrein-like, partial [Mizuhopecten yessoensis]|uniref:plasma kallikrein-like n=1 Tax=Mizuhopecten yessoensis TaxID=6573 RepID=UPI000B45CAAA